MNTNAASQLTELQYDRVSILIRAIHATYRCYTQQHLFGPIFTDLSSCAQKLVSTLLWITLNEGKSLDDMLISIARIIDGSCAGRGEETSDKFRAELYAWALSVSEEYKKMKDNETNNTLGNQEGGKQV